MEQQDGLVEVKGGGILPPPINNGKKYNKQERRHVMKKITYIAPKVVASSAVHPC
jgi:hypothetical protein